MTAARKLEVNLKDLIDPDLRDGIDCIDLATAIIEEQNPLVSSIAVGSGLSPLALLGMALDQGYTHLVQSDSKNFQAELNSAALMLKKPNFMVDYPISTILQPLLAGDNQENKLTVISQNFSHARDKHSILDEVSQKVGQFTKSNTLIADIVTIADELLTNAIFNAPYVDKSNSGSGISRSTIDAAMTTGNEGQFFLGADGERAVVGCRDPYGSLNVTNLLKRVRRCYETSVADTMNMNGTGGAGIGSYMVFNASSSYFVVVDEDRITLVCSVIPLKGSSRSRQEAPKNLHYIYLTKG